MLTNPNPKPKDIDKEQVDNMSAVSSGEWEDRCDAWMGSRCSHGENDGWGRVVGVKQGSSKRAADYIPRSAKSAAVKLQTDRR